MNFVLLIVLLGLSGRVRASPTPAPGTCVPPAVCTPPSAAFSRVIPVQSRQQWVNKDGYCGSLSVQTGAMAFGMWISQDKVRRAAGGEDVDGGGLEVGPNNIIKAMDTLKITHEDWDYQGEPQPQYKNYMAWLKKHLSAGHPVVWHIITKESPYHPSTSHPLLTHIEPVWGIYSNHSLSDPTVYDDDVIVHGADYWASGGVEAPSLYRTMASLPDDGRMAGNCAKATPEWGKNEFYPCIMYDQDCGNAITGFVENSGRDEDASSVPLSLAVDRFDEPEYPWTDDKPAAQLHGTVTISDGLDVGSSYTILRWDNYKKVPTNGRYYQSAYDHAYNFTAKSRSYVFQDPAPFLSSGTTYYRCLKGRSDNFVV